MPGASASGDTVLGPAEASASASAAATADAVQARVHALAEYLRGLGFEQSRIIDQVLSPSVATAYFSAKALSAIAAFATRTRRALAADAHGRCESNALRDGARGTQLQGKGRGSAHMSPAEHEHNNGVFWAYVAAQGQGFLAI
jgi:hypothetical protein